MTKCLYVGNVPKEFQAKAMQQELRDLFHGESRSVVEVDVPVDRRSGLPRGFAFVTMQSPECAQEALQAVDGVELHGNTLAVGRAFREERIGNEEAPPPHMRPWNPSPAIKKKRRN
jgi:RNA recognition motif-containing protein